MLKMINKRKLAAIFLVFSVIFFTLWLMYYIMNKTSQKEETPVDDGAAVKELVDKMMKGYKELDANTILCLMYDSVADEVAEDVERHFVSLEDRDYKLVSWKIKNMEKLKGESADHLKDDYLAKYAIWFSGFYVVDIEVESMIDGSDEINQEEWMLIFVKYKDNWYFME